MDDLTMSLSSSVHPSETSEHAPEVPRLTNTQRQMHARDFDAWQHISQTLALAQPKRAARIAACCCCPLFVLTSGAKLALVPGYCRDRMCPTCARRRSRDTFHRLHAEIGKMDAPRFITLTLKHKDEPLFLTLARLRASFRELRKHDVWKSSQRGGVYCIEVKRNEKSGLWHAHIHIIADGDFVAQRRLSAAWKQVTGDSFIVDIRPIRSKREIALYVTKYISKPADVVSWPNAAVLNYAHDMAGVRMVSTFGTHHRTNTEQTDDGCYAGSCEPLASSRRVLRALNSPSTHTDADRERHLAATVVHLCGRIGGQFARALGLPQLPEGEPQEPPTIAEHEELVNALRQLGSNEADAPPEQREVRRALLRVAFETSCPWPISGE